MPGSRGVPPKKRGRFIPCRGGGTATTYYTDWHDVDENEPTIASCGERWFKGNQVGVSCRYVSSPIHYMENTVASRLIYLS